MSRPIKMPEETSSYHPYNANPAGKRAGDCVIRAISTVLDMSWEDALSELTEIALHKKYAPLDTECYQLLLQNHGWVKKKMPKKFNNTRYRGYEFCDYLATKFKHGKEHPPVLAHIGSHHITAFISRENKYKCWDIWDCTAGCIGTYWVKY